MYHLVIFASFAFIIFPVTNVNGIGMELVSELNNEIDRINHLIIEIQHDFHDPKNLYEIPSNYLPRVIKKTNRTLKKAISVLEDIERDYRRIDTTIEEEHAVARNTRRSNKPEFEKEFYAVLAKILKNKLRNEPLVNEKEIDNMIGQQIHG